MEWEGKKRENEGNKKEIILKKKESDTRNKDTIKWYKRENRRKKSE